MTRIWHLAKGDGTPVAGPFMTMGEAVAVLEFVGGETSDRYVIAHNNLSDYDACKLITNHHRTNHEARP